MDQFRLARRPDHRYFWKTVPSLVHFPPDGLDSLGCGLFLLYPFIEFRSRRSHRLFHLLVRRLLLSWRRPCAFHLLRRGLPSLSPRGWYGLCCRDEPLLGFRPFANLPEIVGCLYSHWRLWLLRVSCLDGPAPENFSDGDFIVLSTSPRSS